MSSLRKTIRVVLPIALVVGALLIVSSVGVAQRPTDRSQVDRGIPAGLESARLDQQRYISRGAEILKLSPDLEGATGRIEVVVQLSEPSVAAAAALAEAGPEIRVSQLSAVSAQQRAWLGKPRVQSGNMRVLGSVQRVLNAVMLEIDASQLEELAKDPEVRSISRVGNYRMDLSETVPYIGATAVQNMGFDGTGVSVAVLDSGVDYYHANLGGSGNPADYAADDPTVVEPGTFPTAKVVGGFDFVGGVWPSGPLAPDPDPLDDGSQAGHGTHVADIIGGVDGVAPGADIYAVKVCSSISSSCSGVALIQGMDFAVDPNGDGDLSDHVDIVNMSLGANYGQPFDDDLSQAVDAATAVGVLTVSSAGNGADKPYVTGTPSSARTALSVAQTNVPSAFQPLMEITAPSSIAGLYAAVFQPWSVPPASVIEAPVQYGDGAGGNLNGCAPFAPGSLSGLIVLVDRGACNFTLKISNIGNAGGEIGIIGLVAPGAPFPGGDGGDPVSIPGYMISLADSNTIKSELGTGVVARFDPTTGIPLIGHMVGSSSRGPAMGLNIVKPEIGAPGASVSANAGTGTGVGPFGGTSGASPMVAGSAALLLEAYPNRSPAEIKAVLMNTAETDIMNEPAFFGGDLAPITRIGGGEVRVDRALNSEAAAWDMDSLSGALSFGFHDVADNNEVLQRRVLVRNYSNRRIHYNINVEFRFPDDAASGKVDIQTPNSVVVPANSSRSFNVVMQLNGKAGTDWALNSGSQGNNGDALTAEELDGYITLTERGNGMNQIHLAWHVLPRAAGDVTVSPNPIASGGTARVRNNGVYTTTVESYSLIGTSPDLPEGAPGAQMPTPDLRYVGYATFPVPAGFCGPSDSFVMAFAVNTWERQTHVIPVSHQMWLDTNMDSVPDYVVLNRDVSFNGVSDGRNLAWVLNLTTGSASAFFFTDHETNSGNTVLLICGDQIGMNASNFFDPIGLNVISQDFYYGGPGDSIGGIVISPLGEQYLGVFEDGGVGASTIGPRSSDDLTVVDFGPITNNTETGLLLLYRGGAPEDNEAEALEVR